MNLGGKRVEEIHIEIRKAHDIIMQCIGHEPQGFIAPAWSTSCAVVTELINLHYFDTSVFTSIFLYPILTKMIFNHLRKPNEYLKF